MGLVLVTIRFAGPRRLTSDKLVNFESGIESVGNARIPFSIKYFLTAILFVLFDVEVIFMYPWAVNFKVLGMVGFVEMVLFIGYPVTWLCLYHQKRRVEMGLIGGRGSTLVHRILLQLIYNIELIPLRNDH